MLPESAFLFAVLLAVSTGFVYCFETDKNNDTLQLLHVFFRHGSRTPETQDTYPSDPYKMDSFLPMGWGQLTNRGKKQAFNLGKILRSRYNNFLGSNYNSDIVRTFSTDLDRTKMTALLVLAGLFPPSESETWDDSLPWQPIPYHYDKSKKDYTLKRPLYYCPKYSEELEKVLASPQVQQDIKTNRKLFQYIEKNTKKPINKLMDVFKIYQTLNAEDNMNLTLPKWTKSVYPTEIHNIAGKQCFYENSNAILKRLNGGRMLAKVIRNMLDKAENRLVPDRKIYLYSGHENNVINILAALDLFQPHVPKYCSAVIIELHYDPSSSQHAVKVYYLRDLQNNESELQKLDACEDPLCPLNDFIQITKPHVPVNYTAECGSTFNLD